jgi:Glycosyltransferase 61
MKRLSERRHESLTRKQAGPIAGACPNDIRRIEKSSLNSHSRHRENMRSEPSRSSLALIPSRQREGADVLAPVPLSIRTIWASSDDADVVTRMRNAPLGQLYRNRLKRFIVVRGVARWIWWNLFPLYVRLSVWMRKRYPLITLSDYAKTTGTTTYKLVDAESVETTQPKVFPIHDRAYVVAPGARYGFPEIFVAAIKNGTAVGGTNLILVDGKVVCHDLYDFELDYTAEELHGRALISPKSMRVRLVFRDKRSDSIPVAATFVDACAPNYAHWMTEVLPRIALFCADERFKDVPVVVNDGLHPNIMESLFLVVGTNREVITLPNGKTLAIGELYYTSATGYVPFERRTSKGADHSHGMFSPRALEQVRKCLGVVAQKVGKGGWPEKIFLRRNSGVRRVINAAEIENLLMSYGYAIVEPETLTFAQQVQYFAHAKVIVGPTGAGFANVIFCQKGTHVAVLISKCKDLAYKYWVNMFASIDVNFSYVLGDIVDNQAYGVHGDFEINTPYLMEFLRDLEHN